MKFVITSFVAAGLALAASASPASSADTKTWYVYCEGNSHGDHWVVFSENFWPHPMTEGYGRQVGSAAKAFFEAHHDLQLEGCAAVNFVDFSLAEYSRSRTARLHRKMGDRVFFFPLPDNALPVAVAKPAQIAVDMRPVDATAVARAAGKASEPSSAFTPQHVER